MKKYILEFRDGLSMAAENLSGDFIQTWGKEINEPVKKLCIIETPEKKRFAFCWSDLLRVTEQ